MCDAPEPRAAPGLTPGHPDGRLVAPAAARNCQPIVAALQPLLAGRTGLALEIGSGTGQHAAALAHALPALDWQPSDPHDEHLASIRAWAAHAGHANLRPPLRLDAAGPWPDLGPLAAVLSANVIHIAPWAVAEGIVAGAGRALAPDGLLTFYGPFKQAGSHTGEGNRRFDASLRAQNPGWGIRDIDDLAALGAGHGLALADLIVMPANNRLAVFRRLGGAQTG